MWRLWTPGDFQVLRPLRGPAFPATIFMGDLWICCSDWVQAADGPKRIVDILQWQIKISRHILVAQSPIGPPQPIDHTNEKAVYLSYTLFAEAFVSIACANTSGLTGWLSPFAH